MGNKQSLPQNSEQSYLIISPSPLGSLMKRPSLLNSASSSPSNRSNRSVHNIEPFAGYERVIRSEECNRSESNASNKREVNGQHQYLQQENCSSHCQRDRVRYSCHQSQNYSQNHQQHSVGSVVRIMQSLPQHACSAVTDVDTTLCPKCCRVRHQHLILSTKTTNHNSMDSCKECLSQEERTNLYLSSGSISDRELTDKKLVIEDSGLGNTLVPIDITFQLSMTESTIGEMTEADQSHRLLYDEDTVDDDTLVERGGSFKPHPGKPEDKQMNRHKTVEVQREDDCLEGQTRQFDFLEKSDDGTTCWTLNSTATNGGQLDSHCHTSLSTRNASIETRTEGPPVYINPRTGECHSIVFGSIRGEGASMAGDTGAFSGTHENSSCISMNPSDMPFETGSFSIISSRESHYHSGADFKPGDHCGVFDGRGRLFDSFGDIGQSLSAVQDLDAKTCCDHEDCGQSNQSREVISERQRSPEIHSTPFSSPKSIGLQQTKPSCPVPSAHGLSLSSSEMISGISDVSQQSQVRSKLAISSCESCDTGRSVLTAAFGSHSSMCQFCSTQSQLLAAGTNSFSTASSSTYRSQVSRDSWHESFPELAISRPAGSCCMDYDTDNDSCSSHDSYGQLIQNTCKCGASLIINSKINLCCGATKEVDECEIATEGFGLEGKPQISCPGLKFGLKGVYFCKNIYDSQVLAESEIRGTDTGEFNGNSTGNSTISVSTSDGLKTVSSNSLCCTKDKGIPEGECVSDDNELPEEAEFSPHTKAGREHASPKCSHRQERSNNTLPVAMRGQHMESHGADLDYKAKSSAEKYQHDKSGGKFPGPSSVDQRYSRSRNTSPNSSSSGATNYVQHESKNRKHDSGTRSKGHDKDRQNRREEAEEDSRVRPVDNSEEDNDTTCLLKIQHSRSISCDCNDPFKRNYVAYLCCAPEDLSSFGLTFHRELESWGFRIFIAPRDLELTGPKYDNMARWLEERCNGKIIVVLSENYGKSDECMFLTYFARTLDPDSKNRNIIPVMIDKDVEITNVLKGLSIIKYNYDFRCGWLKKKLVDAIAA